MNYDRFNNTEFLTYENNMGDFDLYFHDPNSDYYFRKKDRKELKMGEMILRIKEKNIPQKVKDTFRLL